MHLWNVGDKSEGICPHCKALVSTTFAERTIQLAKSRTKVDAVLVAACDNCDAIVSIPAQAEPQLKEARDKQQAFMRARVNRRLEDALRLIAAHYDVRDQDFRASLLKYYLFQFTKEKTLAIRVKRLAHAELSSGKTSGRIEFRLTQMLKETTLERAREMGIGETDLLRGVIAAAFEDVFERKEKKRTADLEVLAATA